MIRLGFRRRLAQLGFVLRRAYGPPFNIAAEPRPMAIYQQPTPQEHAKAAIEELSAASKYLADIANRVTASQAPGNPLQQVALHSDEFEVAMGGLLRRL